MIVQTALGFCEIHMHSFQTMKYPNHPGGDEDGLAVLVAIGVCL